MHEKKKISEIKKLSSSLNFFLSFDLGVTGDYEGMYTWLAKHEAKECGDNMAVVSVAPGDFKSFPDDVVADLKAAITVDTKTRIYMVWKDNERFRGKFIVGHRRPAPWAGYAMEKDVIDDL